MDNDMKGNPYIKNVHALQGDLIPTVAERLREAKGRGNPHDFYKAEIDDLRWALAAREKMTCGNCKHWKSAIYGSPANRCGAPHVTYGYGQNNSEVSDSNVYIEDDEGWGMVCGPEFGCNRWAAKA